MNVDPELEQWRKEWSSAYDGDDGPAPGDVIAAATRYQRCSQLTLAANIIFAVLLLGASLLIATRMHSRKMVLWAVCVWMTTPIAGFLAVESWRRSRIEDIEKVADYAAFHSKRAIADQWKVRTGPLFLVVQVLIAPAWLTADLLMTRIRVVRFGTAMIVLLAVTAAWIFLFAHMWQRAKTILETTSAGERDRGPGLGNYP